MRSRESSGPSLGARLLAILVLAAAVWILLKVVVGFLASITTLIVVVIAVAAVIWALRVL